MEALDTEDGHLFIKSLASFIRTHEKALANALQMRRQNSRSSSTTNLASAASPTASAPSLSTTSTLAAALSLGSLSFSSHNIRPAKLTLTAHHLFYLLSRLEEVGIQVGPMNIRLESLHAETSSNYVSFLHQSNKAPNRGRSDKDSIHSVSSVRSVMSSMSSFWSTLGLGSGNSKSEKAKAAEDIDLKYIYSAFTKIPCLRLSPDHRARLIKGYEEFPFDTAVPLHAFKNVSALEVVDVDFRQFHGWDRLAEQLVWLTVKRAHLDNVADLFTGIVLDDADRRRRRLTKTQPSPTIAWAIPTKSEAGRSTSDPGSPSAGADVPPPASPRGSPPSKDAEAPNSPGRIMPGSISPGRPLSRHSSSYRHIRTNSYKMQRSGSGSSNSSDQSIAPYRSNSTANLPVTNVLSPSKWRSLKYLSLADNALTILSSESLSPIAATLRSLDLSSNLFADIPDSLACLTALRSLDLSNCMIESLHCLTKSPLPAVTVLKLRSNRLRSLAGIERLLSLERLDIADNRLTDPAEAARLTGLPNIREIWVKHNPFTKTHSNYRVTIFNLFRRTPGYTEDIYLDNTGPGYNERKLLVERVMEPERPPVVRSVQVDESMAPLIAQGINKPSRIVHESSENAVIELDRPSAQTAESDPFISTTPRRKKMTRRRIVDLSRDDSPAQERPISMSPVSDIAAMNLDVSHSAATEPPPLDLGGIMGQDPTNLLLRSTVERSSGDEEDYRRRLEILKQELGNNWLSVLGDRGWDGNMNSIPRSMSGPSPAISPIPPIHRTNSQAITSGGRTLG